LAAGLLIVQAQSGDGNPLPEAEIIVGHAKKGDDKIEELRGTTDARGEARFEGLDTSTQSGYLVEVRGTGGRASSKPFALSTEAGARVLLMVGAAARTSDPSSLQVGPDSHFIVEVTDEAVQVIEVLRILNPSSESVDVPGGLKLPLPERAVQAQAAPGSPASLTVAGHEATLSGEIPPGETQVAIIFMMATSGGTLDIVQQTTLPFAAINVVHERKGELRIEGLGPSDSRDLQGRSVALYHGPGVARGGQLRFTLAGLPHADATWRLAGGGVAGLLLLALLGWSFGGRGVSLGPARRAELERERERLLEELVAYDRTGGTGGAARTKLVEELARVYQALDQA
jgi:hypothetical protein